METGTVVKFPWIYGDMPRGGGSWVKIDQTLNGHGGQGVKCLPAEYFKKFALHHNILIWVGKFTYTNKNATLYIDE
jgi:hypothetical protein